MTYQAANGLWQGYMGFNGPAGTAWPPPPATGYSTTPYVVVRDNGGQAATITTGSFAVAECP